MSRSVRSFSPARSTESERRSLLRLGWVTAVLGALHLGDHALRGERVHSHDLPTEWDHSGWPFESEVTPYTFSLLAVALILGAGLWGTHRGRLWAGFWLGAALVLGTIVTVVHLLPTENQESPSVIYGSWEGLEVLGIVSVGITFGIVVVLPLIGANAIRVGRRTGRWF